MRSETVWWRRSAPTFDARVRFWALAGRVSIRGKLFGMVLVVIGLMLPAVWYGRVALQNALDSELERQSAVAADSLAARAAIPFEAGDNVALQRLLQQFPLPASDLLFAVVIDPAGRELARVGTVPPASAGSAPPPPTSGQGRRVSAEGEAYWEAAAPIGESGAVVRVALAERRGVETVSRFTSRLIVLTSAAMLLAVAIASLLTWLVTRPIRELEAAATAMGEGDFGRRVVPWAEDEVGSLARAFNHMGQLLGETDRLRSERQKAQSQLLERVIWAQEEERKRVARELHDETGQALTSLMMYIQALEQRCSDPALKPQISELRQLAANTLEDVARLAIELRPSALDDLGLHPALDRYVEEFAAQHGLEVDLMVVGLEDPRLDASVETALYRIVQEALTNVARHARATTACVLIERRAGWVRTIVEDDGIGFDVEHSARRPRALGLVGMHERAELLGGTMEVESLPGHGTSIFVRLPS